MERGFDGVTAIPADCGAPMAVGEALEALIAEPGAQVDFLRQCLSVSATLEENMDLCIRGVLGSIEDVARDKLLATAAQGVGAGLCLESGGNWFWRLSERVEFCGGQAARSRVSSAIS